MRLRSDYETNRMTSSQSQAISLHHLSTKFLDLFSSASSKLTKDCKIYEVVEALVIPHTLNTKCSKDGIPGVRLYGMHHELSQGEILGH